MYYWYFKLFNNIKSEQESVELAKLELEGLFGKVKPIHNFFDVLKKKPLSLFTDSKNRIQDFILHELPYGKIQGYFGKSNNISVLESLVKRLAYTREIFLIGNKNFLSLNIINRFFSKKSVNRIFHWFEKKDFICFRFITYQYFLEKSEYISKISRNESEIDRNVEILFSHLIRNLHRIPASSTLSIGKRLEDYFAIREEPSLYLTHYFHPYKGKFHPKMARALLNYVYPYKEGKVMDNFAGSGTLLVEASLMELENIGIEINPLSVLMSNVKCNSLKLDTEILKKEIENYFNRIRRTLVVFQNTGKGQLNFDYDYNIDIDYKGIERKIQKLSVMLKDNYLRNKNKIIPKVLICKKYLSEIGNRDVRNFLLLALSGAISDVARRTKEEFHDVFIKRVNDLYLRLYLFQKLNEVLLLKVGESKTYEEDARDMISIKNESIDGIVNSPPYSVALDYIKNDYPQLVLLELSYSIVDLEKKMIGSPRVNYDRKIFSTKIEKDKNILPPLANTIIEYMIKNGREQAGLRSYKFFVDMHKALKEMYRVMKGGSKCAIVIGNNHFKVNNSLWEVPNDQIILEISKNIGFSIDKFISRELHKSSEGMIKAESIIILIKEV